MVYLKNNFLIIILLFSSIGYGQLSIESSFNAVQGTARSQNLCVKFTKDNFSLILGAKYLINSRNEDIGYLFKKMFHATKLSERLGLDLGYQFTFFERDNFKFNFFQNFQFTKAQTRLNMYYAIGILVPVPKSEEDYIFQKKTVLIGPVRAFETNMGIGLSIKLTPHLYLTQKTGVGIAIIKEFDPNAKFASTDDWFFTEMVNVGIGYSF